MYESPIQMIREEVQKAIEEKTFEAVEMCDIQVDREELIKALRYDRDQYNKGYEDGKREGFERGFHKARNIMSEALLNFFIDRMEN